MRAQRISRRSFIEGLGSGLALVGLSSACAPIRPSATAGQPPANATTAPGQGRKGGALVLGLTVPIVSTAPYPGSQFIFGWAIFNPLVSLDSKRQPIPHLADSWTFSEDRLTLTLRLRPGVAFHSGRAFSAGDAKWSIEYTQDPKHGAAAGGELKAVQARAVDAATLELKLPDLMPHIFSLLAGVMMIDPQSDVMLNPVGTGPFKLDGFKSGDEMRLVRNERYWRPDRPYLDSVTIKTMPDPNSAIVALESGATGLVQCAASDVQRLKTGSQTMAVVLPGSGSYDFAVSAVDPPFTDSRVRQAIDLALDRKRFADTLMYGLTDPTYIIWMRQSPAWEASVDAGEFNLDKARQLLTEAGYPNGFETKIQATNAYPELVQFDEIVQADLAKIGINASIERLDANEALTLVTQAKFSALINHVYAYGDQDPAMQFTAFVLRPEGNASRFRSDPYSKLVVAARHETDWDKRMGLYRQIATLVKNEAFLLPIANFVNPWGIRSNVHGIVRQPLVGYPALEEVWLE